ncbi:MAG: restriction endonuclease [Burkholderiales bacterium]
MARSLRQRKGNPSTLQGFIHIVALLPWWAGVLLAGLSYPLLHRLAVPTPLPPATGAEQVQVQALMWHSVFIGLATAGQYVVPLLCLMGGGASFLRRRQRQALAEQVTASPTPEVLNGMTWQAFEQLVGEAFRQQGYRVEEHSSSGGADGGVDLVLGKHHEIFFVQCKQWKALKVGVDVVRQLYGVMAAHGTAGGFVVTSGRFTAEARTFAEGRNVTLVDGAQLHEMLKLARQGQPAAKAAAPRATATTATPAPAETPACPTCGSAMAVRMAKKGQHAGRAFWGCVKFPGCRGVVGVR